MLRGLSWLRYHQADDAVTLPSQRRRGRDTAEPSRLQNLRRGGYDADELSWPRIQRHPSRMARTATLLLGLPCASLLPCLLLLSDCNSLMEIKIVNWDFF
ncbi:hypothetical protein SEVIR_1G174100v4 [Setaria viridis]|uniref:Uncharacterized protein n=1 Tax=Setaria viridis TaxID=4556 RepID=A0A4U6WLQ9_SETVI|nr:hypothetical protein SEVIR_1G174100v2 [Setaria viridis]